MPDISLIQPVLYDSMWPYHVEYDNIPLQNILKRIDVINAAVDRHETILAESVGGAGTLSNRLAQSLDTDGNLIPAAVDEAMHGIAHHADEVISITPSEVSALSAYNISIADPANVSYVRMLEVERAKLGDVSENATALKLTVETAAPSTTVTFDDQTIIFRDTTTVQWSVTAPNIVRANMGFPTSFAHRHYYNVIAANVSLPPDYIHFKVSSPPMAVMTGTLRVYVNGLRIERAVAPVVGKTVYVPTEASGLFAIYPALTAYDVVMIDYDVALA